MNKFDVIGNEARATAFAGRSAEKSRRSGTALLAGTVFAAAMIAAAPGALAQEAWFSPEQVERGAGLYEQRCAVCHGEYVATSFSGWSSSAQDLIDTIISFGMPQDNPGGLPAQQYTDIVAYILTLNGLPVGDTEVAGGSPELHEIRLP